MILLAGIRTNLRKYALSTFSSPSPLPRAPVIRFTLHEDSFDDDSLNVTYNSIPTYDIPSNLMPSDANKPIPRPGYLANHRTYSFDHVISSNRTIDQDEICRNKQDYPGKNLERNNHKFLWI